MKQRKFGAIYYKVLNLQRPFQPFIAEARVQFEALSYVNYGG